MNDITNLRDTIIPKSDQLNADDLVGTTMTIVVTVVFRGNQENPLVINYNNDGGRPYKPCKTMRKLLIAAWGENGNDWIGHSITLFCDSTVKWAGKEVGGIRISHLSHIEKRLEVMLAVTRGKKQKYTVNILQSAMYPEAQFNDSFEAMKGFIESGSMTKGQVIAKCNQTGMLSNGQVARIESINTKPDELKGFTPATPVEKEQAKEADISPEQETNFNKE